MSKSSDTLPASDMVEPESLQAQADQVLSDQAALDDQREAKGEDALEDSTPAVSAQGPLTGDIKSRTLPLLPPGQLGEGLMPRKGVSLRYAPYMAYGYSFAGWTIEYAPVKAVLADATALLSQQTKLKRSQTGMVWHTDEDLTINSTVFTHVSDYDSTGKPSLEGVFESSLKLVSEPPAQDICGTIDLRPMTFAQFAVELLTDNRAVRQSLSPTRNQVQFLPKGESEPVWLEDVDPLIASTKYMPEILKGPPGTSFYPPSTDSA